MDIIKHVKVVCLGDPSVERIKLMCILSGHVCEFKDYSCIRCRLTDVFYSTMKGTAGKPADIQWHNTVDYEYFDCGSFRRMTYSNADVMLLAFALDEPYTFHSIEKNWIPECLHFAKSAKILLVGIQSDKDKTNAISQEQIEILCKTQKVQYCTISFKTLKGVIECRNKIIDSFFEEKRATKKRRSVGDGFSFLLKKGTRMIQKFLPEKKEEQNVDKNEMKTQLQEKAGQTEQSELHAIFNIHGYQIFRPYVVDNVLSLSRRDLKQLCVALGYDQKALRQCPDDIKNPYWQMLKYWTEILEDSHIVSIPLMYRSLMNIKQKAMANDLSSSINVHYTDYDLLKMIEKRFRKGIETDELLKLKAELESFEFTKDADQTPPVIWKMGRSAGALYNDILQGGKESRHCIRLMVVGPYGAGKTCLVQRLLKKNIIGVVSTNGINIMVLRCKVRLNSRTWIFSDDLLDHALQDRQIRLYKNIFQRGQHIPAKSSTDQTRAQEQGFREQLHNRHDNTLLSKYIPRNIEEVVKTGNEKPQHEKSFKSNRQQDARIAFQQSGESLLKDFDGLQLSAEDMEDFAEVVMLDFAGQYEFYATHQTFLNKHAVYLLVLDISKDLKGSLSTEDLDDAITDLSEIPFKDIGEYVNFWLDAIHCYSENEAGEDKSEENFPSVIVVGTCSDKLKGKEESRQDEISKQLNEILGDHVKKKLIKDFFILSNLSKTEEQFDLLREKIFNRASEVKTWGQELPVRWIKLEQKLDILRTKDNETVISFLDVVQHGKDVYPAVYNEKEIELFLNYQHEIGNIIFFADIPEYIILQPQWLVDVLKCLISAPKFQKVKQLLYSSDWVELETTGRLSEDLLKEIFSQKSMSYSLPYKGHILKVMEKFDIIVKPSVPKRHKVNRQTTCEDSMSDQLMLTPNEELDENPDSSNLNETTDRELSEDEFGDVFYDSVPDIIDYYVPSLIKTNPISYIVEHFNVTGNQCKRSSWLCMDFYFLPPAFFNHLLVGYIRRYPISIEPSKKVTKLALYRGMGVFNLNQSGCIKLAICVFSNVVQLQVWYWQEPSVELNERVWEEAKSSVNAIKRRYKMNVNYTLKLKCMSGSYNNPIGMVDVEQLRNSELYYCNEHGDSHKSKEILGCWFRDDMTDEKDEILFKGGDTIEIEAKLNRHFQTIVNEIGAFEGIVDDMISQCLISTDNRRYIEQYHDQHNQTRRLLKIINMRGPEVYSAFLEILRKHSYQKLSESLKHEPVTQENIFYNIQDLSTWKVPLFRVRLQKNYTDIVSTITHESIVDHLITEGVLTLDDKYVIESYPAPSDKIRKLMEKLMYTEETGYFHFLSALRLDDCYVELANQIEKTKVTPNDISLLTCCSKLQVKAHISNDKFVSEYKGTNL